jgi:hypothetical protein
MFRIAVQIGEWVHGLDLVQHLVVRAPRLDHLGECHWQCPDKLWW